MDIGKFTTIKSQVEYVLKKFEHTRNDDLDLTIAVWEEFYYQYLSYSNFNGAMLNLKYLKELPREDTVKRFRAWFQNRDNKYLPTDPKVMKRRGLVVDLFLEEASA